MEQEAYPQGLMFRFQSFLPFPEHWKNVVDQILYRKRNNYLKYERLVVHNQPAISERTSDYLQRHRIVQGKRLAQYIHQLKMVMIMAANLSYEKGNANSFYMVEASILLAVEDKQIHYAEDGVSKQIWMKWTISVV